MAKLVLLFTVVPLVELWLLLAIGRAIGFWPTVGIAVGTAFLGAALAKHEGRRVLASWTESLSAGRVPDEGITGGVLVLLGAALLVSPGVLTDITGLLLLFPPARRQIAKLVRRWLERRALGGGGMTAGGAAAGGRAGGFQFRVIQFGGPMPGAWGPDPRAARRGGGRGEVIDVQPDEVVEENIGPREERRTPPKLLP